MLIVYRGKHCPRCKRYLNKLNTMLDQWTAKMNVIVVSADSREKARADQAAFGWRFDLCYGMTKAQMRALGLYVSDPLSEAETTTRFAEPGTFAMRPDSTLMLVDISNGPAPPAMRQSGCAVCLPRIGICFWARRRAFGWLMF